MKTAILIIAILIILLLSRNMVKYEEAYKKKIQRINDVYKFKLDIINLVYSRGKILFSDNKFEEAFKVESLKNKWDYMDMVNSYKPLVLKEWYTEDEIKLMKGE